VSIKVKEKKREREKKKKKKREREKKKERKEEREKGWQRGDIDSAKKNIYERIFRVFFQSLCALVDVEELKEQMVPFI
jgi:hypothetical protein